MHSNQSSEYSGSNLLANIEEYLPRYNHHVFDLICSNLEFKKRDAPKIADFGAGTGTLAELFRTEAKSSPLCIEIDDTLRKKLIEKGFTAVKDIDSVCELFSTIYSSNVLEHIQDDEQILEQLYEKLEPGGLLILYLPALEILYSKLDLSIGHFRRYNKSEIVSKLESKNFRVLQVQYCDILGLISTLILKFFRFSFRPNAQSSKLMKIYDSFILPISVFLDEIFFKKIAGKNLFVVAMK